MNPMSDTNSLSCTLRKCAIQSTVITAAVVAGLLQLYGWYLYAFGLFSSHIDILQRGVPESLHPLLERISAGRPDLLLAELLLLTSTAVCLALMYAGFSVRKISRPHCAALFLTAALVWFWLTAPCVIFVAQVTGHILLGTPLGTVIPFLLFICVLCSTFPLAAIVFMAMDWNGRASRLAISFAPR